MMVQAKAERDQVIELNLLALLLIKKINLSKNIICKSNLLEALKIAIIEATKLSLK